MPHWTIETTYRLPIYRRRAYEADTLEEACEIAVVDEGWEDEHADLDTSGDTYVTGIWEGGDAAASSTALSIPSQFGEAVQRKADHFETLLGLVKILAHDPNLTAPDLPFWRPRAEAAIAKAEAILAGARDPDAEGDAP